MFGINVVLLDKILNTFIFYIIYVISNLLLITANCHYPIGFKYEKSSCTLLHVKA